jgi:enoyl-CoA hydratase/carnithine racemase
VLSLNSPHNRNAISRALLGQLSEHVEALHGEAEARGWGTRVLVIESAVEGVFCAGADLRERKGWGKGEYVCFLVFPFFFWLLQKQVGENVLGGGRLCSSSSGLSWQYFG